MGFGGPVWHASVSPRFAGVQEVLTVLWTIAEQELGRVGDAMLGEWREVGDRAVHLRRRLTEKEMRLARIDAVCDVRGTSEFSERVFRMRPYVPVQMRDWPETAFP